MIQLNDLRIGNWISLRKPASLIDSFRITNKDDVGIYIVNGTRYELLKINGTFTYEKQPKLEFLSRSQIKGIPLSILILTSCGFQPKVTEQEQGLRNVYLLANFAVEVSGSVSQFTITSEGDSVCIAFVHELQNLYFKQMGKELDITIAPYNYQLLSSRGL